MNEHPTVTADATEPDAKTAPRARPRPTPRYRLYLTAVLIDTIGSGLWMPVGLIFFTKAQGLPVERVGLALSAGALIGLLTFPVVGSLVDRWGPAFLMVLSNLLRAVSFACYPGTDSPWHIVLLAAVNQTADRMFWTSNAPLLGTMVRGRALDRILGTQSVVRIIGLGIGAGISGLLAGTRRGLHLLAWVNAGSYVLAAVLLLCAIGVAGVLTAGPGQRRRPPPKDATPVGREPGWREVLADRPFLLLCTAQLLYGLCATSLVVILPLVSIDPLGGPPWLPGASIVAGNVVLAVIQKPVVHAGRSVPRRKPLRLSAVAFACTFLLLAPAGQVPSHWVVPLVLGASMVGVVGEALFAPFTTAAAHQAAPRRLEGRYSALFQGVWGLVGVVAPTLFARLLAVDNSVLWLTLAVVALSTLPVVRHAARGLPATCLREVR